MRNSGGLTGSCKSAYTLIIPGMFSIIVVWTQLPESTQPTLQVSREHFSLDHLWWDCDTCHHLQMGFPGHLSCITISGQGTPQKKAYPGKYPNTIPRKVSSVCSISNKQGDIIWGGLMWKKKKKKEIFRIANRHALASMHIKPMSYHPGVASWLVLNFREVPLKI